MPLENSELQNDVEQVLGLEVRELEWADVDPEVLRSCDLQIVNGKAIYSPRGYPDLAYVKLMNSIRDKMAL